MRLLLAFWNALRNGDVLHHFDGDRKGLATGNRSAATAAAPIAVAVGTMNLVQLQCGDVHLLASKRERAHTVLRVLRILGENTVVLFVEGGGAILDSPFLPGVLVFLERDFNQLADPHSLDGLTVVAVDDLDEIGILLARVVRASVAGAWTHTDAADLALLQVLRTFIATAIHVARGRAAAALAKAQSPDQILAGTGLALHSFPPIWKEESRKG